MTPAPMPSFKRMLIKLCIFLPLPSHFSAKAETLASFSIQTGIPYSFCVILPRGTSFLPINFSGYFTIPAWASKGPGIPIPIAPTSISFLFAYSISLLILENKLSITPS